jgi:hypothetical protein
MKAGPIIVVAGGAAAALALYFLEKSGGSLSQAIATFSADVGIKTGAVDAIAQAIATAEGFYTPGTRPARDHNPGDMTIDLIGKGVGMDGPFIVYATDDDGWANLKEQITKWFDGSSANADSSSTIADLSSFYTDTQQDSWATNVANALGVSTDTPLSAIGGS